MTEDGNKAARELGKLGAAKGGRARASVMTPEERRESARQAVLARWRKEKGKDYVPPTENALGVPEGKVLSVGKEPPSTPELPYSMFRGKLPMGNMEMECHVLSDLRRVLTQTEVVRMISGGAEGANLARYLSRNPLTSRMLDAGPDVEFRIPGQPNPAHGYEGTFLVDVCTKYLEARQQGLLGKSQLPLAMQAEIVLRACAKVGITALIDEATGYQEVRAKRSLQLKLQAFIAEDMQEWAQMFPEDFWLELARLESIRYSPRNRPLRWGRYVMMFVYDAIDADVGKELRKKNPSPHFLKNHHQWLKKYGREKVNNQIQQVIAVMKLCRDMDDFRKKFAKVFKKSPIQLDFEFEEWPPV